MSQSQEKAVTTFRLDMSVIVVELVWELRFTGISNVRTHHSQVDS